MARDRPAYGFRDPATMSFDAGPGHYLFFGDDGYDLFESIKIVFSGDYDWNIREGNALFQQQGPLPAFVAMPGNRGGQSTFNRPCSRTGP
jgi:hypothetical protein